MLTRVSTSKKQNNVVPFYLIKQCISASMDETSGIPGLQPATQPSEGVYLPHEPCGGEPFPNETVNALKYLPNPGFYQRELGSVPRRLKIVGGKGAIRRKSHIIKAHNVHLL